MHKNAIFLFGEIASRLFYQEKMQGKQAIFALLLRTDFP